MVSALIFTVVGLLALIPNRPGLLMGLGRGRRGRPRAHRDRRLRAPRRPDRGHEGRPRERRLLRVGSGVPRRRALRTAGERRARCSTTARSARAMHKYDGNPKTLTRYDTDPRALPFKVLGAAAEARSSSSAPPAGNEILASLHFNSKKIEGVELNPVTLSLLTDHYKKYSGDLEHQPGVSLHQADGRTYLAREQRELRPRLVRRAGQLRGEQRGVVRCVRALRELPLHEGDDRRLAASTSPTTGSWSSSSVSSTSPSSPNRTARYVMTARAAMKQLGIKNPSDHMIVSAFITNKTGDLSTIMLKRTPFTPAEVARYTDGRRRRSRWCSTAWAPGETAGTPHRVPARRPATDAEADDDRRRPTRATSARSATTARSSGTSSRFDDVIAQHLPPAQRARTPRTPSASACCCCCSASSVALRRAVPARAVLLRAQGMASAARPRASRPSTSPRSGSASCSSRSR